MSVDTYQNLEATVTSTEDSYTTCEGAHALTVLMEWDKLKEPKNTHVYKSMVKSAFVFGKRTILDHDRLQELGF